MKKLFSLLLFLPLFGISQVSVTVTPDNSAVNALQTAVGLKADKAGDTFTGAVYLPTAAAGTNNTQAASTAFVHSESYRYQYGRPFFYRILGSKIIGENLDGDGINSVVNGASMANQRMFFSIIRFYKDTTCTGLKWKQITQGSSTANNYNGVGLYEYNGSAWNLVASSTNDGTIWNSVTAGALGYKAFSSSVTVYKNKLYAAVALWCRSAQTTVPQLGYMGTASATASGNDYTGSNITSGYIDSQTSLPSTLTMSSATFNANQFWFGGANQ